MPTVFGAQFELKNLNLNINIKHLKSSLDHITSSLLNCAISHTQSCLRFINIYEYFLFVIV